MQVIVTHSIKDGTGKTTLTINLASSLARDGKKVIICDFNLLNPALNFVFKIDSNQHQYINDYLTTYKVQLDDILIEYFHDTFETPMGLLLANPNLMDITKELQTLITLSPNYLRPRYQKLLFEISLLNIDYLIIDNLPGFHAFCYLPLIYMDTGLVLLRPDISHKASISNLLQFFTQLNTYDPKDSKKYLIVNYLSDKVRHDSSLENWLKNISNELKIPILSKFPYFEDIWNNEKFIKSSNILFPLDSPAYAHIQELKTRLTVV